MAERAVSALYGLAAAQIEGYVDRKRDASAEELHQHFLQLANRATRFVRLRKEGHYGAYRIRSDAAAWLVEVLTERVQVTSARDARTSDFNRDLEKLLSSPNAEALSIAAQTIVRRQRIDHARSLAENPYCSEEALRKALSESWWIFGGQYVGEATHRRLAPGLEIDIPLLCPNGILHIVELKRANVKLIKRHRANYVPTSDVNDAIGQILNYLCALDERRDQLLQTHQIDSRRARGTVVIGHPIHSPEFDERQILATLRNHSSHLGRVEVVTYKELLDSAERALAISDSLLSEGQQDLDGPPSDVAKLF